MNDEELEKFYTELYSLGYVEFLYNKKNYYIETTVEKENDVSMYRIQVAELIESNWTPKISKLYDVIYEDSSENLGNIIEFCLISDLFEGKSFDDIQDEIEIIRF